jgi:hypothetical protein
LLSLAFREANDNNNKVTTARGSLIEMILCHRKFNNASRQLREMVDEHDPLADAVDIATSVALCNASESRYLFRPSTYRKGDSETRFQTDLKEEASVHSNSSGGDIIQPWLNNDEFLHKYRMTRASFKFLLDQIKDHPVFHTAKKRKQAPVEHQVMTWLKYVGTELVARTEINITLSA